MKAVIFDMDGVIIDSEPLWRKAERQVFADVGLELSDADCERTMGMRTDEVIAYWFARAPWTGPRPDEIEQRLILRMQTLISERGQTIPGFGHALGIVRSVGLRTALASSSSPVLIDAVLRKLELTAAFDVVQIGDPRVSRQTPPRGVSFHRTRTRAPTHRLSRHRRFGGRGPGCGRGRDAGHRRAAAPPFRRSGVRPRGRQAEFARRTHPADDQRIQCGRAGHAPPLHSQRVGAAYMPPVTVSVRGWVVSCAR